MSQRGLERKTEETRHIGTPLPRTDAPSKVAGRARFTADRRPRDLLHAKLVPSPVPHARLQHVDASAAEALDGVVTVVTGADVPDGLRGQAIRDRPILPTKMLRFAGEPVAVIAAETEAIAEEAAGLVEVTFDRLDAVFDPDEALAPDPPAVVHENVRDYEFVSGGRVRYEREGHVDSASPNLLYADRGNAGDVDNALARADHVIEGNYEVKPVQHCSMEPHVAVARADFDGLNVWTSHQVPHHVKKELLRLFPDISAAELTVQSPFVGGGFGGKATAFLEPLVVAVAMRVGGMPVRLCLTRAEEFTAGINRPQVRVQITDGVTDEGRLIARDADIRFNIGAYNEQGYRCTCSAPSAVYGSYSIPNVRWLSQAVYTNLPVAGAFRGFGKPEVNWALERHMDRVAERLDLDPVEYRAANLLREGDRNSMGETLGPNDTEGCLRAPIERLRTTDIEAICMANPTYSGDEWVFGTGLAYGNKPAGTAAAPATVYVHRDMHLQVHVGAPDIGQGSDTAFTQIAAEAFDIASANVKLVAGDTDRTPYNRGPTGSRFTYHTGNAIRKAANDAKRKLFALAAQQFDDSVDPDELDTANGEVFVRADPTQSIPVNAVFSDYDHEEGVAESALIDGGELIGTATYDSRGNGEDHAFWTPVGQAAVVAVNTLTGRVDILRFCTAADVGRAINPKIVEQQLEGAAAQGIGFALYEEIVYDGGHVVNPNFKDYRIPGAMELPYDNEVIILESMDDEGPFGAKGVGEMGVIASAPAVGNAIADALGVDLDVCPLSPVRILERLDS